MYQPRLKKMIKKFIKNNLFLLLVNLLIIFVSLINKLPNGYIISHGDGYQYFDFSYIRHLNFTWDNLVGQGGFLTIFSNYPYYFLIGTVKSFLHISLNYQVSLNYLIFLLGSFWSFYLASGLLFKAKNKPNLTILLSLIYSFNVFTLHILIDDWGCSPFYLLYILIPLIFALTYKIFLDKGFNPKLFLFLGILFVIENIPNSNLPFFVALCILLFLLIILISFFKKRFEFKKIAVYCLTVLLATAWSVLPQIIEMLRQAASFNGSQSVFDLKEWIIWQSSKFPDVFFFIFNFSTTYLAKIHLTALCLGLFIFFLISIIKEKNKIFNLVFLTLAVVDIFLINKGVGILPKEITLAIFQNPILASLRSFDKTAIFLPFLVLVVITNYFINQSSKSSIRWSVVFLTLLSVVSVFPLFTGKALEKYSTSFPKGKDYLSAAYAPIVKIPQEYFQLAEKLNYNLKDSKILRAPYNVINSVGWVNFPKWKLVGADPTVQLFDDPSVQMNTVGYFGVWNYGLFWNNQSAQDSKWLLPFTGLLNTDYIVYHKDVASKFVEQTKSKIEAYEKNNDITKLEENDYFALYRVNDKYSLPHFYSPTNVLSTKEVDLLPEILSNPDYDLRSAVFVENQNESKMDQLTSLPGVFQNSPTIEFKKINPTKYRLILHGAKEKFPLVFSETFSDNWKLYLGQVGTDSENKVTLQNTLENYKIFEGNDQGQATKEDLIGYINRGLISTLGDSKVKTIDHNKWVNNQQVLDHKESYKIGFVSKDIKDTIQNDNLKDGSIAETWFKTPIDNGQDHLQVNGYANSWIIDPSKICADSNKCVKNADGSYDMEIVVEFWSQRLYYLGGAISGASLLICIGCLIYFRKRKIKGSTNRQRVKQFNDK